MSDSTFFFASLQAIHARAQMGTYFSRDDELDDGLHYLASERIADSYWNYAYGLSERPEEVPRQLALIIEHARSLNRPAVVAIDNASSLSQLDVIADGTVASQETWMILSDEPAPLSSDPAGFSQRVVGADEDLRAFLDVFAAAYGEGEPGQPGYSSLPPEYVESLATAEPAEPAEVIHVLGAMDGAPVAIASAYVVGEAAGLYNVGTAPAARRRGLGSRVSHTAICMARNRGVRSVFLQTEPDSEVEELYAKLGFSRQFVCSLIELSAA